MKLKFCLFPVILIWCAAPALGQVTFGGCRDIRGIAVASVANSAIADVAKAALAPDGTPVISYNPAVLSWLQPQTRVFIYFHECAHHALGHTFGTTHPLSMEQAADCWGICTAVKQGQLSSADIGVVQSDIARIGVADWTHLPGPQRAINLQSCLASGTDGCVGGEERECELKFRSWKFKGGGSASFSILIDGEDVAFLSNDDGDDTTTFPCPSPGNHSYRLDDIEVMDDLENTLASGGYCEGILAASRAKTHYRVTLIAFPRPSCMID